MTLHRRALLQHTAAAAGLALAPPALMGFAAPARAQSVTLMAMVFLSKRLDASTQDFRDWYIKYHADDFLSYGRKYLTRYTQDFVEKGHMGDVDFDCISEFGYKSHELREALFHHVEDPNAKKVLDAHPRPGKKPGPNEAHDGPRRFSIDEQLLSGAPRVYDKPGAFKQAAMLRIKPGVSRLDFQAALVKYGFAVSKATQGATERVMIDWSVPEPGKPETLFDGVVQLWPKNKTDLSKSFANPPKEIELVNILDLLAYEKDLSGA